jgi:hypothetical protein
VNNSSPFPGVQRFLAAAGAHACLSARFPSWTDTARRRRPSSPLSEKVDEERFAGLRAAARTASPSFDNDGTLWAEQPMYFQFFFALDRVKALAPQHPEWKDKEPFASLLKGDVKGALAGGEQAIVEIVMATHAA